MAKRSQQTLIKAIYDSLTDKPQSIKRIAETCDCTWRTAKYNLMILVELDLALQFQRSLGKRWLFCKSSELAKR